MCPSKTMKALEVLIWGYKNFERVGPWIMRIDCTDKKPSSQEHVKLRVSDTRTRTCMHTHTHTHSRWKHTFCISEKKQNILVQKLLRNRRTNHLEICLFHHLLNSFLKQRDQKSHSEIYPCTKSPNICVHLSPLSMHWLNLLPSGPKTWAKIHPGGLPWWSSG